MANPEREILRKLRMTTGYAASLNDAWLTGQTAFGSVNARDQPLSILGDPIDRMPALCRPQRESRVRQYNVPALDKAVAILDLLAKSEEELTATEIHQELGIPKATAFMLLNVLERHQMVKRNDQHRYTIGIKLYELGITYVSKLDVVKTARPFLEQLLSRTNLTSHLGTIYDHRVIFIDKIEPKSFIRFSTFPGMRSDIHMSSLGKAMAAHLTEPELDEIVAKIGLGTYTVNTITDRVAFDQELERIRQSGYAIENEEGELGIRCVGAPIFDNTGRVVAAVSVTGLVSQIPEEDFPKLGQIVRETAESISTALGGAPIKTRRRALAGV
jgi:DNA-binding IclR family transcriptional regulator